MHTFSPTYHVLGDPLQLFPAQPRLRDVCLNVTLPGVFQSPHLSHALRVPRQGLSRNVTIWLSQCVAKPSPSSLKNSYLYSNLVVSLPEDIIIIIIIIIRIISILIIIIIIIMAGMAVV